MLRMLSSLASQGRNALIAPALGALALLRVRGLAPGPEFADLIDVVLVVENGVGSPLVAHAVDFHPAGPAQASSTALDLGPCPVLLRALHEAEGLLDFAVAGVVNGDERLAPGGPEFGLGLVEQPAGHVTVSELLGDHPGAEPAVALIEARER